MKLFLFSLLSINVALGSAGLTNLRLKQTFVSNSKCSVADKQDCGYYGIKQNGCEAKVRRRSRPPYRAVFYSNPSNLIFTLLSVYKTKSIIDFDRHL